MKRVLLLLGATLALGACNGGGGGGDDASPQPETGAVPNSFTSAVLELVGSSSETSEPVSVEQFTETSPETTEPVPVS